MHTTSIKKTEILHNLHEVALGFAAVLNFGALAFAPERKASHFPLFCLLPSFAHIGMGYLVDCASANDVFRGCRSRCALISSSRFSDRVSVTRPKHTWLSHSRAGRTLVPSLASTPRFRGTELSRQMDRHAKLKGQTAYDPGEPQ
jgi:hypothetical protein